MSTTMKKFTKMHGKVFFRLTLSIFYAIKMMKSKQYTQNENLVKEIKTMHLNISLWFKFADFYTEVMIHYQSSQSNRGNSKLNE